MSGQNPATRHRRAKPTTITCNGVAQLLTATAALKGKARNAGKLRSAIWGREPRGLFALSGWPVSPAGRECDPHDRQPHLVCRECFHHCGTKPPGKALLPWHHPPIGRVQAAGSV